MLLLLLLLLLLYDDEYVYLGTKINTDGSHDAEINERINKDRIAISKLNGVPWDRNISSRTKTKIFNTIVRSTIMYGAETWTLLPSDES